MLYQFQQMPSDTAAKVVRQHQDARQVGTTEQFGGKTEPKRSGGIVLYVLCHQAGVMRITSVQQLDGMALSQFRVGTKAHRTLVKHERIARQQVMPAARAGPQAEVVLLAVATAERIDIELADIGECGAPNIHA